MFPKLSKLPTLPKFSNLPNFFFPIAPIAPITPITPIIPITPFKISGRTRYFRNPQSVVPALFTSALPRSKSPSKEGDLGGG